MMKTFAPLVKRIFFILVIFGFHNNLLAQIPDWQWASSAGGTRGESGNTITTDLNGNVYVTGYFSSQSMNVGGITIFNNYPSSIFTHSDIFLIKYSPSGVVLWANSIGGNNDDEGTNVICDSNGNIYITGYFKSTTINFGVISLNNTVQGWGDFFVAKYDPNGNVIWARSGGGNYGESINSCILDNNQNLILLGNFASDTLQVGGFTLYNSSAYSDILLLKYTSNGYLFSAKSFGGTGDDVGISITIDNNNDFFIIGNYTSDSISFGSSYLVNKGYNDIFVVKLDPILSLIWNKSIGESGFDLCHGMSLDNFGNIYLIGEFGSPNLIFDSDTIYNYSTVGRDIFFAKYDYNGNSLWANSVGGFNSEFGNCIKLDSASNIYISGTYESDSILIDSVVIVNNHYGFLDTFLAKYDPNSNLIWVKSIGGKSSEHLNSFVVYSENDVYCTGWFKSDTLNINSIDLVNSDTTEYYSDFFVVKLGDLATSISVEETAGMEIFPNPTVQNIWIDVSENSQFNFTIFNLLGEKVYENYGKSSFMINLKEMSAGTYLYSFLNEKGNFKTGKIIKE